MQIQTRKTARARVRQGIRFLDEKLGPGWRSLIDLDRLNMASGNFDPKDRKSCGCILAQLDSAESRFREQGQYWNQVSKLGLEGDDPEMLGTNTLHFAEDFGKLTKLWKEELGALREEVG